jgi:hypothetical protein
MTSTNYTVGGKEYVISVSRTKNVEVIKDPGLTLRRHMVETLSKRLIYRDDRISCYGFRLVTTYEFDIELERVDDNSQAISSEAARSIQHYIDIEYKILLATGKIKLESKDLV